MKVAHELFANMKSLVAGQSGVLEEARNLRQVRLELEQRTSPRRVVSWWWLLLPWTNRAKLRVELAKAARETRAGIYHDELNSIRRASQLLNRYARVRALVISGVASTELRARGEVRRFETITHMQFELTQQFLGNVDSVNKLESSVPPEFKDALKERVFNDYIETLNRSSRILSGFTVDQRRAAESRRNSEQGRLWKD